MMKKTVFNTLLITFLAVAGTSCNSAHELMEPVSLAYTKTKLSPEDSLTLAQRSGVTITTKSGATVTTKKAAPAEKNFITSLNKFLNMKYANMLGVLPQVITNDLLYDFIDEWYGTRYRLGGTDKRGIDCSAFVQRLYARVFNISLFRTAAEQFNLCHSIWNKEDLKEGDLVFFNIHKKRISHVGIYLMNDYFVHSCTSQGVMISRLSDAYWKKYYAGAGRVPREGRPDIKTIN
ncbi:MAG: C40 family peptidase [Chitinophagaceae bacterium]|nr:C40 family peptidase [Chitinophagaceae bacterium]